MSLDVDPSKRPALAHWSRVYGNSYLFLGQHGERYATMSWSDVDGWVLDFFDGEQTNIIVLDVANDAGSPPKSVAQTKLIEHHKSMAQSHAELAAHHQNLAAAFQKAP